MELRRFNTARCLRQISCHTSPAAVREERERGRVERESTLWIFRGGLGHICHLPGNFSILIHVIMFFVAKLIYILYERK